MNNAAVTTGTTPLTIGSTDIFKAQVKLGGIWWDLTGGVVTVFLMDPNGNQIALAGSIIGGVPQANWTVAGPVGNWVRAWKLQDASGIVQYSRPLIFSVISSP